MVLRGLSRTIFNDLEILMWNKCKIKKKPPRGRREKYTEIVLLLIVAGTPK